jgi:hypothetical protein
VLAREEASRKVLEEKRKETVKLRLHKSEKTSFTAFGGITSSGDKWPVWVIAKGKTKSSEATSALSGNHNQAR